MGLFSSSPTFDNLEALLLDQLRDVYDAERRLTKVLPKMADAAHDPTLQSVFEHHHAETEAQVQRLERVFEMMGKEVKGKTCEAMKGLIEEAVTVTGAGGDPAVKDAALIASAQRIEHYEMAAYGCARNFARRLGQVLVAEFLQQSLDEEGEANKVLTRIADSQVNPAAAGV